MKRLVLGIMVCCGLLATSVAAWCGDNGNGTVTVNGLVWLKDATCLGSMPWNDAMVRAKLLEHGQCGLTDNSKAGDWRLPNHNELETLEAKGRFTGLRPGNFWSSTTIRYITYYVWNVGYGGYVGGGDRLGVYYVWPVRSVQ